MSDTDKLARVMERLSCFSDGGDWYAIYGEQNLDNIVANIRADFRAILTALTQPREARSLVLDRYDTGLLGDGGGGDVEWWQDYIRAELERAHEFYQDQANAAPAHPREEMGEEVHRSDCGIYSDPPTPCDCHLVDPFVAPPATIAHSEGSPAAASFIREQRLCKALEDAIWAIRKAEKVTNWTSGDPYGESLADELERVLDEVKAAGIAAAFQPLAALSSAPSTTTEDGEDAENAR